MRSLRYRSHALRDERATSADGVNVDRLGLNDGAPRGRRDRKTLQIEEADARIRTADPFITSEVLYQLSYVGADPSVAAGALKGFTEPVALSSPASTDLPPSGPKAFCVPASGSGFDLLALRTRCEREGTA